MFKTSPNFTVGSYLKYHFISPRCMHKGYDSCFVCVCLLPWSSLVLLLGSWAPTLWLGFESWPGPCCCDLEQVTYPQCLSTPSYEIGT